MNFQNAKRRVVELAAFVGAHWFYFLFGLLLAVFFIVEAQRYLDRRETEIQNAKIKQFEEDKAASAAQTQVFLDAFNRQHAMTESSVGAIKEINKTIGQLVINDRLHDGEIKSLSEAYRNARNPNTITKTKTNTVYLNARRNLPLRKREDDILANDAKLYPNANK